MRDLDDAAHVARLPVARQNSGPGALIPRDPTNLLGRGGAFHAVQSNVSLVRSQVISGSHRPSHERTAAGTLNEPQIREIWRARERRAKWPAHTAKCHLAYIGRDCGKCTVRRNGAHSGLLAIIGRLTRNQGRKASVGRNWPTGTPFQLRSGGRTNPASSALSASLLRSRSSVAAIITSAARPAPSSHFTAMPMPSSGSAAQ